jgi:hypothetical protein
MVFAKLRETSCDTLMYVFAITIRRGAEAFECETVITIRNEEDAVSVLRRAVSWKGGYLFVRGDCGGANAWLFYQEEIFAIRNGRPKHTGEILAAEERGSPAQYYDGEWFIDLYDKFESNWLTDHASAPCITLYSREVAGRLEVDLAEMWLRNRQEYEENVAMLNQLHGTHYPHPDARSLYVISALLRNAVIAKYCRRNSELQAAIASAKAYLDEGANGGFLEIVSEVIPGEMPRHR